MSLTSNWGKLEISLTEFDDKGGWMVDSSAVIVVNVTDGSVNGHMFWGVLVMKICIFSKFVCHLLRKVLPKTPYLNPILQTRILPFPKNQKPAQKNHQLQQLRSTLSGP